LGIIWRMGQDESHNDGPERGSMANGRRTGGRNGGGGEGGYIHSLFQRFSKKNGSAKGWAERVTEVTGKRGEKS